MVKKYTNTYCDVCLSNGREVLGSHYGMVPVFFADDEVVESVELDLCDTCRSKITNLIATITYKGTIYSFKDEEET